MLSLMIARMLLRASGWAPPPVLHEAAEARARRRRSDERRRLIVGNRRERVGSGSRRAKGIRQCLRNGESSGASGRGKDHYTALPYSGGGASGQPNGLKLEMDSQAAGACIALEPACVFLCSHSAHLPRGGLVYLNLVTDPRPSGVTLLLLLLLCRMAQHSGWKSAISSDSSELARFVGLRNLLPTV